MAIMHRVEIVGYFVGDRRSGSGGRIDQDNRGELYCSKCYMLDVSREFTGVVTRKQVRENVQSVYVCDGCGKLITGNDQGEVFRPKQQEILKGGKQAKKTGTRKAV